jgi:hypothetical protein
VFQLLDHPGRLKRASGQPGVLGTLQYLVAQLRPSLDLLYMLQEPFKGVEGGLQFRYDWSGKRLAGLAQGGQMGDGEVEVTQRGLAERQPAFLQGLFEGTGGEGVSGFRLDHLLQIGVGLGLVPEDHLATQLVFHQVGGQRGGFRYPGGVGDDDILECRIAGFAEQFL